MDHLRAELEIRGLGKCARELPEVSKKCYELIARVVRECEEGNCFVDPKEVVKEFAFVRLRSGSSNWALVALGAVAIIEALAIAALYFQLVKINNDYKMFKSLVIGRLKFIGVQLTGLLESVRKVQDSLSNKVEDLKQTVEAIKYLLYLMGSRG